MTYAAIRLRRAPRGARTASEACCPGGGGSSRARRATQAAALRHARPRPPAPARGPSWRSVARRTRPPGRSRSRGSSNARGPVPVPGHVRGASSAPVRTQRRDSQSRTWGTRARIPAPADGVVSAGVDAVGTRGWARSPHRWPLARWRCYSARSSCCRARRARAGTGRRSCSRGEALQCQNNRRTRCIEPEPGIAPGTVSPAAVTMASSQPKGSPVCARTAPGCPFATRRSPPRVAAVVACTHTAWLACPPYPYL